MKTPTAPFLPRTSSSYQVFVGVDIAAKTAMVAWLRPGEPISHPISIEQTPAGFALLQANVPGFGGYSSSHPNRDGGDWSLLGTVGREPGASRDLS